MKCPAINPCWAWAIVVTIFLFYHFIGVNKLFGWNSSTTDANKPHENEFDARKLEKIMNRTKHQRKIRRFHQFHSRYDNVTPEWNHTDFTLFMKNVQFNNRSNKNIQ